MKLLLNAAGAIALACISANAANMIQEEVQVAGEGNIIDWDAKVVTATEKRNAGERRELPTAGRSLKSPKTPKSCKASKSSKSSPSSSPLIEGWHAADGDVYDALDATDAIAIFTGDNEWETITFEGTFTYNWFGTSFTSIDLSKEGYISIGGRDEQLGYIDFVWNPDDPFSGGSIKYLQKSSPSSLKISFEDVKWPGGGGNVQAQVELFKNGDILLCYGTGVIPAGNKFYARVGDTVDVTYLIPDSPFAGWYTTEWPECKCWRFVQP